MFHATLLQAALFWAAFGLRGGAELRHGARRPPPPRESHHDRGSAAVLRGVLALGLALAFVCAWRVPVAAIHTEASALFYAGIACMVLGVVLRSAAQRSLGRFFTQAVTLQHEHRVVQAGPYRYVRHPGYSGSVVGLLGVGLALTNWASLAILLLGALIGYGYRIHVEEAALVAGLGEPYQAYMRTTKRLIPRVV